VKPMVRNNVGDVKVKERLVTCPECNARLKPENYPRHMERVHGAATGGSTRDFHYGVIITVSVVLALAISGLWLYNSSFGRSQLENTILPRITNTVASATINGPVPTTTSSIISMTSNAVNSATPTISNTVVPPGQGKIRDGIMELPVSEVGTSAKWYTYDSNGVNVRFFLAKGGDGKIHLAADACDVCYRFKRGYRQTGAVMTCNNCGQTFAINSIGTGNLSGGCWPSYIPMKIEGNNVIIKTTDLDGKRSMFA